jgi:hypothetical protein
MKKQIKITESQRDMIKKQLKENVLTEGQSPEGTLIHNFVMFGFNYPPNWIESIWGDEDWLVKHLKEKFHSIYERYGATAAFFKFYTELDGQNQDKLSTWISQNYNG